MKRAKLADYGNFWLIWLSCAGNKKGASLFSVQKEWGIGSNYLYHRETGLGRPLFRAMEEKGYIEINRRRLFARFEWIPEYVIERLKGIMKKGIMAFVAEKWPEMQAFIEANKETLFNIKAIKGLYKEAANIRTAGRSIFDDILLFVLYCNLNKIFIKHKAEIASKILREVIIFSPEKDLDFYFSYLSPLAEAVPLLIKNEEDLLRIFG